MESTTLPVPLGRCFRSWPSPVQIPVGRPWPQHPLRTGQVTLRVPFALSSSSQALKQLPEPNPFPAPPQHSVLRAWPRPRRAKPRPTGSSLEPLVSPRHHNHAPLKSPAPPTLCVSLAPPLRLQATPSGLASPPIKLTRAPPLHPPLSVFSRSPWRGPLL